MLRSERDAEVIEGQRGQGAIWAPARGVLVTRATGHCDVAIVRFYVARVERELLTTRRVRVFHDWEGVTGYDPAARDALRAFGTTHSDATLEVRYLVRSKIVGMAIQTAGLVLGRDLRATSERAVFEGWVSNALSPTRPG